MDRIDALKEISYKDGEFINMHQLVPEGFVAFIRLIQMDNSLGVTAIACSNINQMGYIATPIVFKAKGDGDLQLMSEVDGEIYKEEMHSIILFRDCCIDPLLSDRIIPIKEYVETLELINPDGIELIGDLSYCYTRNRLPILPTIEQLKEYDS